LFGVSCASLLVLAGSGLAVASMRGFPGRLPEPVQRILAYKHYDFATLYRNVTCFLTASQKWQDLQPDCLPTGRPSVLLWGDSLAAHYYAALKDRFPNVVILQTTMASCAPIIGLNRFDIPHCNEFNEMVLRWSLANRPNTIILSALWPTDPDSLLKLDATVKALHSARLSVTIIGQTPIYLHDVPDILARRLLRGDHDTRAEDEGIGATFWGDHYMKERYSGMDSVRYISSQDSFCQDRKCPLVTESGVPVNWDNQHFTLEGAKLVVRRFFPDGVLMRQSD
jgi:hypothetical protein